MELLSTNIDRKIFTIRNVQVMLDRDLAELYSVETKHINQAVRNNQDKFQEDFIFQLSDEEFANLRSNNLTTNFAKTRVNPKVFTEQGIYMLATILKSKIASEVTVSIIRTFAKMREFISTHNLLEQRFNQIEHKLSMHDNQFDEVFKAIESKQIKTTQGIFYDGQIFDAYSFVSDLIRSAKSEIILIDNYIDDTTLTIFSKVPNVEVTLYTNTISKQLKLDLEKYSKQYDNVEIKIFKNSHDRFLIIDKKDLFHIGASLKDLGKKWFAFSKMDMDSFDVLGRLEVKIIEKL